MPKRDSPIPSIPPMTPSITPPTKLVRACPNHKNIPVNFYNTGIFLMTNTLFFD